MSTQPGSAGGHGPGEQAPPQQQQQQQPQPQQLNRSCESCRALKVRCLPDPNVPNRCQRCTKAKRACIFVAPQRRRPRKRTDSRVAQLEREMAAMRMMLKDRIALEAIINEESSDTGKEETDEVDFATDPTEKPHRTFPNVPFNSSSDSNRSNSVHQYNRSPGSRSGYAPSGNDSSVLSTPPLTHNASSPDWQDGGDVIDRGIISMEIASDLLSVYVNDLVDFFPFVVLPANTTASQLRQSKPVLFLSILAAAAIAVDSSLATILNREMVSLYAQRFFLRCEKSLELVQALLLMNVFYLPPDSPTQIQLYQYSHIAATMALEIGIASKRRVSRKPQGDRKARKQPERFDEQMAEQARAILGCYHLTSNVAMRTRRQNMLMYNDWLKECLRLLSRSPHEVDRRFATWFDLQKITDETLASFGLDDTSSTAPLTEARVHTVLRWFDKRMEEWKEDTSPEMLTVPMVLEYHYTILVIYELAIGEGYRDPDAIKRRYYTLPAPDEDSTNKQPPEPLSAVRVDITLKWLNAAHGLLDAFLSCDIPTIRKMPNLIYSRVVLGIMVLLKIFFSVKSGALGEVIVPQTVNVDMYLEAMTQRLTEASGGSKFAIPARWLRVVGGKARDWYDRFQAHQARKEAQLQAQLNASKSINTSVSLPPSMPTTTTTWRGVAAVPTDLSGGASAPAVPRTDDYSLPPGGQTSPYDISSSAGGFHTPGTMTAPAAAPWLPPASDEGIYSLGPQTGYLPGPTTTSATWSQPPPLSFPNPNPNPPYPVDLGQSNSNTNDLYSSIELPMEMELEWDWVPEGGMFQLPSF
ncbi:hypothetical protein VTN77DRAFT_4358 [Rasamsonia byssochlamydoides]|uniref:uncharacterized protein n=1 Tax=Rasamsonia byssochlamydoides TaxID=89139 RepID=UPI003743FE4C